MSINTEGDRQPNEQEGVPTDLFSNPGKYEENLPLLKRTLSFVRQYGSVRPNKRENLLNNFTNPIIKDPALLKYVIDNIELIDASNPSTNGQEVFDGIISHIDQRVARRSDLSRWTPEKIEQLVQLGLDGQGNYKKAIERMQSGLFNAPQTVEESVDLHYNAAWAMVTTKNPDVRKELFSILCLEKNWFGPKSDSVIYFTAGMFSDDDIHLEKYHAVIEAIDKVGTYIETVEKKGFSTDSQRTWDRAARIAKEGRANLGAQAKLVMYFKQQRLKSPQRFDILSRVYGNESYNAPIQIGGKNYLESEKIIKDSRKQVESAGWPQNVISNPHEPLRKVMNEQFGPIIFRAYWENQVAYLRENGYQVLSGMGVQITEDLKLEVVAKEYETSEQKSELVREVVNTITTGKPTNPNRQLKVPMDRVLYQAQEGGNSWLGMWQGYDTENKIVFAIARIQSEEEIGRLSSMLEYHRPILSLEQVGRIESQISQVRNDLRNKFTKSVGNRGYTVLVADPALRMFGYESIALSQNSRGNIIDVKITIDGQMYELTIDPDYRIKLEKDLKQFKNPQDQAWLELVVLGHLKSVMCSNEENITGDLVGKEKQAENYRKQMAYRIEHLRRLPKGQKFGTEAFEKCLTSNLPIKNLFLINQMRAQVGWGGTPETGTWTYVLGSEWDSDTQKAKPIKIAFNNATSDLRKVVDLGQVTPEEILRIENDILSELENI